MRGRSGVALGLVLGLVSVLGVFGAIALTLSRGAGREVDVLGHHLRAVAVGELGYAAIVGRLSQSPWPRRWFSAAPDVQLEIPAAGGTYSYFLGDAVVPAPGAAPLARWGVLSPNQANLMIRATFERSTVVMFWRLMVPRDALDGAVRVVPTYFTFGPDAAQPRAADVEALARDVDTQIATRGSNLPRFEDVRGLLGPVTGAPGIQTALGAAPPGPVLDSVVPLTGPPALENPSYWQAANPAAFPAIPEPTQPPPPAPPTPVPTPPPAEPVPTSDPSPAYAAAHIRERLPLLESYARLMDTYLDRYGQDVELRLTTDFCRAALAGFREKAAQTLQLLEGNPTPEQLRAASDRYEYAYSLVSSTVPIFSMHFITFKHYDCPGIRESFPHK